MNSSVAILRTVFYSFLYLFFLALFIGAYAIYLKYNRDTSHRKHIEHIDEIDRELLDRILENPAAI